MSRISRADVCVLCVHANRTHAHAEIFRIAGMKNGGGRLDDWHGVVADYEGQAGETGCSKWVALAMDVT